MQKAKNLQTVTIEPITVQAKSAVSVRWFVKRAALWAMIMTVTVASACLLYVAGSMAEGDASEPQSQSPEYTPQVRS